MPRVHHPFVLAGRPTRAARADRSRRASCAGRVVAVLILTIAAASLLPRETRANFKAPFTTVPMYNGPQGVLLQDWNGNGCLEVTVACSGEDRVSILEGDGHGGFGARADLVGPASPMQTAAGDFNADGTADMAIALYNSSQVRVYTMSPGVLTYTTFTDLATGAQPFDIVVTDLDLDGDQDIITANYSGSNVSVLKGNGDGSFVAHADYAVGNSPQALAVGDLNSDGYPDVVTANFGSHSVTAWFGSASGALTGRIDRGTAGLNPTDVVLAKLDDDDDLDVAVSHLGLASVSILVGNGAGDLAFQSALPSLEAYGIVAADFNGDVAIDLAVVGSAGFGTVHLGTGAGLFLPRMDFATGGELSMGVAAGDLDSDGNVDLAVSSTPRNVSILRGNGDGTFGVDRRSVSSNQIYRQLTLAEMTGDAALDVVVGGDTHVEVAAGDGAGDFSVVSNVAVTGGAVDVATADLDGDGDQDVVSINGLVPPFEAAVFLNAGGGVLAPPTYYGVLSIPQAVTLGDLNNDSYPDLVVASSTGFSIFVNQQNGTFGSPVDVPTGNFRDVVIRDMNEDNYPDIIVAGFALDMVLIYPGNGAGSVGPPSSYFVGDGPVSIVVTDVSGDGYADIATACRNGNVVTIRLNNQAGSFLPPVFYPSPGGPTFLIPKAPFGVVDFFILDQFDATVSIMKGLGGGGYSIENVAYGVVSSPTGLAAGHVDGDGLIDLVAVGNLDAAPPQTGFIQTLLWNTTPAFDAAPSVTAPISVNVEAGGALSLTVTAHESNCDAITSLTATGLAGATFTPGAGNTQGTLTYSPTGADVGDHAVTFTASNALLGVKTTQVRVQPSGTDASGTFTWTPRTGDAGTYEVCFIGGNVEGDPPDTSCTTVTVTPGGSARSVNRLAEATPGVTTKGPVVSVRATATVAENETLVLDVSASDTDQLTVDMSDLPPSNDAAFSVDNSPVVSAPANVNAEPGQTVTIHVSAIDPEDTPLASLAAAHSLPPGNDASFTTDSTNTSGTFTWTPALGDSGTYAVSFTADNLLVGTAGTLIHVGSGLAGYWMLNGNGTDATGGSDLSGSGTLYGPSRPDPVDGQLYFQQALIRNGGPSSSVSGAAIPGHQVASGQPFTIESWFQVATNVLDVEFDLVRASNDAGQYWRLVHENGAVTWTVYSDGTVSSITSSTNFAADGNWHHVAVAIDGSAMTLYVDGFAHAMGPLLSGAAVAQGGGTLTVGSVGFAPDFVGRVDEVRIWRRNRTQGEILATMNRPLGGHATGVEGPGAGASPVYRNTLGQNRPNPFNPRTEIEYELERDGRVTIKIFDVAGRLVRTVVDARLPAGRHEAIWDGTDAAGRQVASGGYFYRLETDGFKETRRMILLR